MLGKDLISSLRFKSTEIRCIAASRLLLQLNQSSYKNNCHCVGERNGTWEKKNVHMPLYRLLSDLFGWKINLYRLGSTRHRKVLTAQEQAVRTQHSADR